MRASIVNPYLDTLGGGERYTLSFAKVLMESGYIVDLQWQDPDIKDALEKRFGLKLKNLNIVPDVNRGDGYDLCFWVSDGSVPMLKARNNILHFQVPFHDVNGTSLLNKMKLFRINNVVCNSNFTKKIIDAEFGVKSLVIYPPVDVVQVKPKHKENVILSVGRFSSLMQSKKQDMLIETFKKMHDEGSKGWRLVLAGGVEVGADKFVASLKDLSEGYPIEIVKSPNFSDLKNLYGKSRVFWSASGFEEDENTHPQKVEHFGITVVEAMSAGCVPVVFNAGGHKEIVDNGETGFLWSSADELSRLTNELMGDKVLLRKLSQSAIKKSVAFGYENFKSDFKKIL
jgi:glycosyltransferase involved in cell wall biosynthesis